MKFTVSGICLAGFMAVGPFGAAQAASLSAVELLQQYNLVVKGDLNSMQEVEGNVYIGGNLTGSALQAAFVKAPVPDAGLANVVILGDNGVTLNINDPDVTVVIGGTNTGVVNEAGTVIVGSTPADLVLDASTVFSTLDQWSTDLSHLATTGTYTEGEQGYTFGAGVYNISLDDFRKMAFTYDLAEGETIVFNVSGTDLAIHKNWPGVPFELGRQVVWNFYEAENVSIDAKVIGSVLAPKATLSGFAESLEGSVFALAVNLTNGEIHLQQPDFDIDTPVVPVPATLPLLIGGLGALAALRRRKAV
ncbi:collagen-binding domain-containing protein [Paenirhodobacter populi]|uniref:VPLPA-CTERM sorting domain-containing protein n=1 Tax=Paenirhodobacter populi TaxID=2306993 RepID=A0A443IT53_9RHOB|nr:collagen-binding domain-containing protein [Sinirhodobacter populi]RWR10477.1 VPLPA-CTERM sorting domain-containing protein [Sinirhodobacter populi]